MRLSNDDAWRRLDHARHGILATVHPRRGVDVVPVVYAVSETRWLGIPIDSVKPKTSGPLQRERNLAADERAALLIEAWNDQDWSQLWWVRAELRHIPQPDPGQAQDLAERLIGRYAQYRQPAAGPSEHDRGAEPKDPFRSILVFEIIALTGWAASGPAN